jgi:hypothetical protein
LRGFEAVFDRKWGGLRCLVVFFDGNGGVLYLKFFIFWVTAMLPLPVFKYKNRSWDPFFNRIYD